MALTEVRAFGDLEKLFADRAWPFPYHPDLTESTSAADLAEKLSIPRDRIETVFVNGVARGLRTTIAPGDRVAFVPPGTPGPYRVILGFPQENKARG